MGLMKNLASVIVANKVWVIGILVSASIASGIYFGATYVSDKIEALSKESKEFSQRLEYSESQVRALNVSYDRLEARYRIYTSNTIKNQQELDGRLGKLEAARGKEKVVATKPKLATKVAEKQVEDFQERLACVSGNSQACSRLQSLPEGAHNPSVNQSSQ